MILREDYQNLSSVGRNFLLVQCAPDGPLDNCVVLCKAGSCMKLWPKSPWSDFMRRFSGSSRCMKPDRVQTLKYKRSKMESIIRNVLSRLGYHLAKISSLGSKWKIRSLLPSIEPGFANYFCLLWDVELFQSKIIFCNVLLDCWRTIDLCSH